MCRGNRREEIFRDDQDRRVFLETLGQTCQQTGWIVHAYVLMTNHYHLLVETPEANLSAGMRWFHGTYAQRYGKRHGLVGHVFQGRYKAPLIDPDEPEYFRIASDYIHLNPARAGLLRGPRRTLADYCWSSYPLLLGPEKKRPKWLAFRRVARSLGLKGDDSASRRRYRAYLEGRARECIKEGKNAGREEWEQMRRGWYVGGEEFGERLLDRVAGVLAGKKKRSFGGRIVAGHDEKQARELVEKGQRALGVTREEMKRMRKTDERKQGVAWLVKSRTVMTNEWINGALNMGSRTNIYKAVKAMEDPGTGSAKRIKKELVNI
jgi:REP element-mobilizing transposase RayT